MRPAFLAASLALMFFGLPGAMPSAWAADSQTAMTAAPATSAPATARSQKDRMDALTANNPYAPKLEEMAKALYKEIGKDEAQRLIEVRTGFGMVRTVQIVKNEIGTTVEMCGKANPSVKKDMDAHFSAWQGKVLPVADAQEKRMQAIINKDNFSHPEDVRAFLEQLDKTNVYFQEQTYKNVDRDTSPDACKGLSNSMDENGGKLVDALQKITWPGEKTPGTKTE